MTSLSRKKLMITGNMEHRGDSIHDQDLIPKRWGKGHVYLLPWSFHMVCVCVCLHITGIISTNWKHVSHISIDT